MWHHLWSMNQVLQTVTIFELTFPKGRAWPEASRRDVFRCLPAFAYNRRCRSLWVGSPSKNVTPTKNLTCILNKQANTCIAKYGLITQMAKVGIRKYFTSVLEQCMYLSYQKKKSVLNSNTRRFTFIFIA